MGEYSELVEKYRKVEREIEKERHREKGKIKGEKERLRERETICDFQRKRDGQR